MNTLLEGSRFVSPVTMKMFLFQEYQNFEPHERWESNLENLGSFDSLIKRPLE